MAQLDASVISQIPDSFDYSGSVAKGYALKDMVDRSQLNKLQISREQTAAADEAKLKSLMTQGDITTSKGRSELAGALQKGGYGKQSMEVLRFTSEQAQAERQEMLDKLTLAQQQQDAVVSTIDPIIQKLDTLKATGKYTAKDLDDEAAREVRSAVPQFVAQRPELGQFAMQFMQNPQNLTYAGLKGVEGQTKTGQAMIRQRLDALKESREASFQKRELDLRAADEAEKRRHNLAVETGGLSEGDPQSDKIKSTIGYMTELGVSLPGGLRGQKQAITTVKGMLLNHPDISPRDIAGLVKQGVLDITGEKREAATAGNIAGKVEYAEQEIVRLAPLVKQASDAVERGRFVPVNRLIQAGEASVSDPKLKTLKSYLNTVSNAYDMLAARGGTDMAKRAENRSLFDAADSPQALQAAMDAIVTEAKVSREAAKSTVGIGRRAAEESGKPTVSNW